MMDAQQQRELQSALEILWTLGVKGIENLCLQDNSRPSLRGSASPLMDYPFLSLPACVNHDQRILAEYNPDRIFASLSEEEAFYFFNIVAILINVACLALITGLFLGLLTLDKFDLEILERASPDPEERQCASNLIPIVTDRHLLLVTLLIMDAFAYETLPLFLDALVPSWAAVLLSVTFLLLFGEIIPSGIFTGPRQLYLGNQVAPIMNFFLWLLSPVAWPLARLLDRLTHDEAEDEQAEEYNRGELSALIRIQHERRSKHLLVQKHLGNKKNNTVTEEDFKKVTRLHRDQTSWAALKAEILEKVHESQADDETTTVAHEQLNPALDPREVDIVEGALRMKTRLAMDVYTPMRKVYAVKNTVRLDRDNITDIYHEGYSRVPVYKENPEDENDITAMMGFLMSRKLMLIDWDDKREVGTLFLQTPECVSPRMNLIDLLRILQTGGQLMAFVCARPDVANKALEMGLPLPPEAGFMGIVTLEDIMESLLQDRIYDESDFCDRDRAVATLQGWAATLLQAFFLKQKHLKELQRQQSSTIDTTDHVANNETTPLLVKEVLKNTRIF
jgi:metal transporter CNNM